MDSKIIPISQAYVIHIQRMVDTLKEWNLLYWESQGDIQMLLVDRSNFTRLITIPIGPPPQVYRVQAYRKARSTFTLEPVTLDNEVRTFLLHKTLSDGKYLYKEDW